MRSVCVASAPMNNSPPRTSIVRSASSVQRFKKRVSFKVPKFSDTYRSVQPAIGTSGPSSRSIVSASVSDRGWNNERLEIETGMVVRTAAPGRRMAAKRTKTTKYTKDSKRNISSLESSPSSVS